MGKAPNNAQDAEPTAPAPAPVRIILADGQAIFRVGIRKVFALEDDLRVVAQADSLNQTLSAVSKFPTDVIFFATELSTTPADTISELQRRAPQARIVIVSPDLDEDETIEYMRRGVRGIVTRAIQPDLLVRCVRKVAGGEMWLDNKGINWIIEAYRSQASQLTSARPKNRLSEKELAIISCVTQGMKNKDIANEIGTTEQVVKNYLRKIYDKLGVSDRLELALYCVHHQLLGKTEAELPVDISTGAPATPTDGTKPVSAPGNGHGIAASAGSK